MVLLNYVDKSIFLYYFKNFNNIIRVFIFYYLEILNFIYYSFYSLKFYVYDCYIVRFNIWKEILCKWECWNVVVIMILWLYVCIINICFFKFKYFFV